MRVRVRHSFSTAVWDAGGARCRLQKRQLPRDCAHLPRAWAVCNEAHTGLHTTRGLPTLPLSSTPGVAHSCHICNGTAPRTFCTGTWPAYILDSIAHSCQTCAGQQCAALAKVNRIFRPASPHLSTPAVLQGR